MLILGAAERPAIVMLHGFMGTGSDWLAVARGLQPGFRCLLPTLPGHDRATADTHPVAGLNTVPEPDPIPRRISDRNADGNPDPLGKDSDHTNAFTAYAGQLWRELEPHLPRRFALVGYSLGGRLALELACRHPERVHTLVLESAHPGLQTAAERAVRGDQDALWIHRFERDPWPAVLRDWYRQPVFASLGEAERQRFIDLRAAASPLALATVLRATSLALQPDLEPAWRRLPMALGFITGAKDTRFCAVGARLALARPDLTRVEMDGLGHNCHALAPKAFAALLQPLCTVEPKSS